MAKLLWVSVPDREDLCLVPTIGISFYITPKIAVAMDFMNHTFGLYHFLEDNMTVEDLRLFLEDCNAGVEGEPNKAKIIHDIVSGLPQLMANVRDNVIPTYENEIDVQLPERSGKGAGKGYDEQNNPATTPFAGKAHRLGEEDDDKKEDYDNMVRIIVKSAILKTHLVQEMPKYASIYDLKEKVVKVKLEQKSQEHYVLSAIATMDMFDKEGKKLDNDTTLASLCGSVDWGEVSFAFNLTKRTEIEEQFMAYGALFLAFSQQSIEPNTALNQKPKTGYVGTLEILCGGKVMFLYHFGQGDRFNDVSQILKGKFGIDTGSDGLYKLKHLSSCSYLFPHEPIFGTVALDTQYRVELVVSLKGGVKIYKKNMTKTERKNVRISTLKMSAEEQSSSVNRASIASLSYINEIEQKLQTFDKVANIDPEKAVLDALGTLTIDAHEQIQQICQVKGGPLRKRVEKLAPIMFAMQGAIMTKDSLVSVIASAHDLLEMVITKLDGMNLTFKTLVEKSKFAKQHSGTAPTDVAMNPS